MIAASALSELNDAVWRMEQDLALLEREIGGVRYWPCVRYMVTGLIANTMGFHRARQPRASARMAAKVAVRLEEFAAGLRAVPWPAGGFDAVLLPHVRKTMVAGRPLDLFSEAVITDAGIGRLLILDQRGPLAGYRADPGRTAHLRGAIDGLALLAGQPLLARHLARAREDCREISQRLQRDLGQGFPLSSMGLASRVAVFRVRRALFRNVFRASGARHLFLVTAYLDQAAVAAAADLGMTSVELQHGIISPFHLGYSYPGRPIVPYAPDFLCLFGPAWSRETDLPGNTDTLVIGSPNLARVGKAAKSGRRVLVSSQGTIGPRLFEIVAEAAAAAPDWQFIFRVHPGEFARPYEARLAAQASRPVNLQVSPAGNDFYDQLAAAEVHVGVYSTALHEGMALGARTIVVDLPGAEHLAPAVARGDAFLARDARMLVAGLASARPARSAAEYYVSPVPSVMAALAARKSRG